MTTPDTAGSDKRLLDIPSRPGPVETDFRSLLLGCTPLIDVRAPVEYLKGAFPESVNLPLLDDDERAAVGIRYKEAGQDKAIELGAELISEADQAERVIRWKKFIASNPECRLYCFRGGLRSRIAQHWLAEAGVQIPLVEGGYKAMRSFLIETLARLCSDLPFALIGGRTGNGKTQLLQQLGSTIDLEKLANHRGSSFGGLPDGQPSNIQFENALTIELMGFEKAMIGNVYLEDEARLIGRVCLPDTLRNTMSEAPLYILECDMEKRIQNCFEDYVTNLLRFYIESAGHDYAFSLYSEHHRNSLSRISKRFGPGNYQQALQLLNAALEDHRQHDDTSGYNDFIQLLLSRYYDPMYDYQLSKKEHRIVFKGTARQILDEVTER